MEGKKFLFSDHLRILFNVLLCLLTICVKELDFQLVFS